MKRTRISYHDKIEAAKTVAQEWGRWECPVCQSEHDDPEQITLTTCCNGHTVLLGEIDQSGRRAAFLEQKERDDSRISNTGWACHRSDIGPYELLARTGYVA